jgi:circadian clock protein KaiB
MRLAPRLQRVPKWVNLRFRPGAMNNYILKLYISGNSPRAQAAIANLERICEQDLAGRYTLEIVDVLKDPAAAETDKILATPTLVKRLPPPLRRVIGDLSDKDKVLLGLEVRTAPGDDSEPRRK